MAFIKWKRKPLELRMQLERLTTPVLDELSLRTT
jgi:hypothetical protein